MSNLSRDIVKGNFPKEWDVVNTEKLLKEGKDSIKIGPFGSQLKKDILVSNGFKVYGQENVYDNDFSIGKRYITKEKFEQLKSCEIKSGDILITMMGTIGSIGIVPPNIEIGIMDSHLLRLRIDHYNFDNKYVSYSLKSNFIQNQIQNLSVGCIMDGLSSSIIKRLIFLKPSLEEQKKIASVLSALDSKIEINNHINAELEAMAKTLYDYWFVQFDFPDKNGKPYKTSGGKMVWNEELKREIPDCWESIMIENCLLKESSIKKIPTAEILEKGKFPVIDQSTDFIAGFTNDNEAIIKTDEPRIIFGDHTRILKLINFDFARGADGTQVMLSNNKRMPQHLFFNTLLKIDLSNYGYARHYKFLKDISIILPNETVSKSFETTVSPFYKLIRENIFQNQKLTELRDWLLPMLMNGQVKVN